MTEDLDRLLELADKARQEAESGVFGSPSLNAFIAACDPSTIARLGERVKEAETENNDLTARVVGLGPHVTRQKERIEQLEARLRAAEEVLDLARKSYTRQGYKVFRDALRRYDEAVGRMKE